VTPVSPARLPAAPARLRQRHPSPRSRRRPADRLRQLAHREDFTSRFITTGTSISDGTVLMASIDWAAAITALNAGQLPCSGGERRMLRLAASIAGGVPVSLYDTLPGLDRRNTSLLIRAIWRAAGQTEAEVNPP
jgi:hypothetical protein